jgi:flagellar motor protein MotB
MGIEHLASPDFKGSTRYEIRKTDALLSHLSTVALAYKVTPDISLLARETLFAEDGKQAEEDKLSSLLTVGVALRPVQTDRVHLLFKSEFKYDSEGANLQTAGSGLARIFAESIETNIRILPRTALFLKYAGRIVKGKGGLNSTTQMVESRVTYDLTSKIDLGLEGRHFWQDRTKSKLWGYGVEGGYRLDTNLWLSIGYRVNGFDQESFTEDRALVQGVFVRLRYKFDEHIADFIKGGPMTLKGTRQEVVAVPVPTPVPVLLPAAPKATVFFTQIVPVVPPPVLVPVPIPEMKVAYQEVIPPPPPIEIEGVDHRVYFGITGAHFKFDSAQLTQSGKEKVAQYAEFLKKNPNLKVMIEGHTDLRGPKQYNYRLGFRRAKTVWNELKRHQVQNEMGAVSYGEARPMNPAKTKSAYTQNRRVEISVDEGASQEGSR